MAKIFLPQFLDESGINAQCLNAKALMKYFSSQLFDVHAMHDDPVSNELARKSFIHLHQVWPWRFWRLRLFLQYLASYDAIFYPNADVADVLGLKYRQLIRRKHKIITTLEGLVGDGQREKEYSNQAGHPVYCQRVSRTRLARCDYLLEKADLVIAISPFLAKMGQQRYGDKFVVLPLGIDNSIFYADSKMEKPDRPRVVSAGTVKKNKRPKVFYQLAKRHSQADFYWYGDGIMRKELARQAIKEGITNLYFPGSLSNDQLAIEFRKANIFVLPSKTEGVPKVTQEAAACGLPLITYGCYEAPSVVPDVNGFAIWDDEQLSDKVAYLLDDLAIAKKMGEQGAKMAQDWSWATVAKQWQTCISSEISRATR